MAKEVILHDENGNEQYPITGSQQVFRNGTATTVEVTLQTLETGLEEAQPKEAGKGLSTNDYTNEDKEKVSNALLKTQQTLTEAEQVQVQENIGVKSTVDVVGAGTVQDIPVDIAQDNMYRGTEGSVNPSDGYYISKPLRLTMGDIISGTMLGTSGVVLISEVNANGNFLNEFLRGNGTTQTISFVANKNMYVSFSSVKAVTKLQIVSCEFARLLAELTGINDKTFESYGAIKNKETGYWELNGFNDITDMEMWNIYRYFNFNDMSMFAGQYPQNSILRIRTNIPFQLRVLNTNSGAFLMPRKWSYIGTSLRYVEKVVISKNADDIYLCADNYIGCKYLFYGCTELKEVIGIIDFSKCEYGLDYVFRDCPKLKSFKLKGLHISSVFDGSPCINLETWTFMIENATNTKATNITVDTETYSYLTGVADPIPEVGGTKEEWMALVTTAQEKQISFATA